MSNLHVTVKKEKTKSEDIPDYLPGQKDWFLVKFGKQFLLNHRPEGSKRFRNDMVGVKGLPREIRDRLTWMKEQKGIELGCTVKIDPAQRQRLGLQFVPEETAVFTMMKPAGKFGTLCEVRGLLYDRIHWPYQSLVCAADVPIENTPIKKKDLFADARAVSPKKKTDKTGKYNQVSVGGKRILVPGKDRE